MQTNRSDIMLLQFRFKNHCSFADEAVLDLTATSQQEHKDFLIEKNGNKVLPIAAIFGANASGKSNVYDAFYRMHSLVWFSNSYDVSKKLRISPFYFEEKSKSSPSEFEIFINIGEYEYQYGFIVDENKICEEWLIEKPFNSKTVAKGKVIFSRIDNDFKIKDSRFNKATEYLDLINEKMLLLSFLGGKRFEIAVDIYDWFFTNDTDFNDKIYQNTLENLYDNPKKLKKIISLLNEFDPCIKNLVIDNNQDEEMNKFKLVSYHKSIEEDKWMVFPFSLESQGTQKLFRIYYYIIDILENGGIFFADELDCRLHPLIFRKIVAMFHDKEINKGNAQLVFTSHNLVVLDNEDLRRDEVWFVEKNGYGKSSLYSLAEFKIDDKAVRSDMDYTKNYLAGRFGAIPFNN